MTGNGYNGTQSGGSSQLDYILGAGAGGQPGGVAGGDGIVTIEYVPDYKLQGKYTCTVVL